MRDHIVEIESEGRHISVFRGFLFISDQGKKIGEVPLDDIQSLIFSSRGGSITTQVMTELSSRGIPIVIAGNKYLPQAFVWPTEGNHLISLRIQKQISATEPLKKQIWKKIVKFKINGQANVLKKMKKNISFEKLKQIERLVLSGDKGNNEALGAKIYWNSLLGNGFCRGNEEQPINSFLNYGYAILRSSTARATAGSGMHPSIGIFHRNRFNPFCLVDDLMEPFRPVIDLIILKKFSKEKTLEKEHKKLIVNILRQDMQSSEGRSPLSGCIQKFVTSVALSFQNNQIALNLPEAPLPLDIEGC